MDNIKEMVEDFKGNKGDEKYEDIQFYQGLYQDLLIVMENEEGYEAIVRGFRAELELKVLNDLNDSRLF